MANEIRYPCTSGEMRFHLKSVLNGDLDTEVVVGTLQDLNRLAKDICGGEELIIDFEKMTITIHDWYLY